MKKSINVLAFLIFFISGGWANAGTEPVLTSKRQGGMIAVDSVVIVQDDKYSCIVGSSCSPAFNTPVLDIAVILGVDHDDKHCYSSFTFSVRLELKKTPLSSPGSVETDTVELQLVWNAATGVVTEDKSIYRTKGYIKIESKVLSITSSLGGGTVPENIYIENIISKERYYALNYLSTVSLNTVSTPQADEIVVSWDPVAGAEGYDLEYLYIDDFGDYDPTSFGLIYKSASILPVDFRFDATRVTVKGTSHTIKNLYQHGYLLFRVRFVGMDLVNYTQRQTSLWSSQGFGTTVSGFGTNNTDRYAITTNHEDTLNWQWTTTFAEEGKNKSVISYFDGSLRSRQMVTYTNTDRLTIVAESFYDHAGRKAVDALPVPTADSVIKFYHNFNLSAATHKPYNWKDFDTSNSVNNCNNDITGMDTLAGASRYYSHNNPDKNLYQAYVPDAKQYPFVQVEFMPDNTGRVRRQSGVGIDHKMGGGHETEYFYGKPTQDELDMMFGVEVGNFNRYKKNMVVDPNGSVSVSYMSPAGKVIATALAGTNPGNLQVLPVDTARKQITEDLAKSFPVVDSTTMTMTMSHDLLLSASTRVDFDYKIKNDIELGCSGSMICYDCVYDLRFTVTDLCAQVLYDTSFIGIKPLDSLCSNDSFEYAFYLDLEQGAYRITKELSINRESIEYYEQLYINNNTCVRSVEDFYDSLVGEIDYSLCDNSCDECLARLGSFNDYRDMRFADVDTNGMDIDSLLDLYHEEYDGYVADCKELCDTPSFCEIEYTRLLQDVSPGGQYAQFAYTDEDEFVVTDNLSFLRDDSDFPTYKGIASSWKNDSLVYFDQNGDTAFVYVEGVKMKPNELPDSLFVEMWDPAWAKTLVKMHPEYCYYEWCILNEESNRFDFQLMQTETYATALSDSLLDPLQVASGTFPVSKKDPFFKTGGLGYSSLSAMTGKVNTYLDDSGSSYSMWEAAAIMNACTDEVDMAGIATCLGNYPFGSGSTDLKNSQWQTFRSIYLSEKQKLKDTIRALYARDHHCTNCYIGHNNQPLYSTSCTTYFTSDSLKNKQKQYPGIHDWSEVDPDSGTKWDVINKSVLVGKQKKEDGCREQCESYADQWMRQLADCEGFSADSAALRDSLINICKLGCDQYNPMGARSVSPENRNKVINQSFKEVLDDFFTINKLCNEDLIPFPYDYNHEYFGDNYVFMDSCFTSTILQPALDGYGCTYSTELSALSDVLKSLSYDASNGVSRGLVSTNAEISLHTELTTSAWNSFKNTLMSHTSGNQDSLNKYYSKLSGTQLLGIIKSHNNGAWDSCVITFNLPAGHTTGFYDSIYDIDALLPNPDYSSMPPYKQFTVFGTDLNFETFEMKASSDCYSVCSDTGKIETRIKNYLNETYCKDFTDQEVRDMIDVLYGDTLKVAVIPRDLSCKPGCITCDKYNTARSAFWTTYGDIYENTDTAYLDTNFIDVYTNYLNNYLGFNQDYYSYKDLEEKCDSFYTNDLSIDYSYTKYYAVTNGCDSLSVEKSDTLFNLLSLCDKPYVISVDTLSCDSIQRLQAYDQALALYNAQMDTLKGNFRRQYIQKCMNVWNREQFNMTYDLKQYHFTLYYYDQADNLIKTVPPEGVHLITDPDTIALVDSNRKYNVAANYYNTPHHTLVTNYKYNTLNAVIEQTTPDGGTSHFFYDRLGRLTVSQNEKQAQNSDFSYTKYDALGRITEVGETRNNTGLGIGATASPDNVDSITRNDALLTSWLASSTWFRQVTKTYYNNKAGGTVDGQFTGGQQNLRNRVAYVTYDEDAMDDYDYATYYTYDIHGNVKTLVQDYTTLQALAYGYFKIDYSFDLISGNVNKVSYQNGKQDQFFHEYVYDADNRIRYAFTSRDNLVKDNDAKYSYYQHGPLARTEIGDLKVQGMDYAYTIHGWLKGVNSATLDSSRDIGKDGYANSGNINRYIPKDEFGFTLGYYQGDYYDIGQVEGTKHFQLYVDVGSGFHTASPSLFNGNIRHMVTAIGKFMEGGRKPFGYAYNYDHLNRLASMDAYDSVDMSSNSWYIAASARREYHNRFTYDANGNILSQVRRGAESINVALDSLVYNYYPGTNRLAHVDDIVSSGNYSDDIDDQDTFNYKYDEIGNLIYDRAEEIDTIDWNVYGKIKRIVRSSGSLKANLEFEYSPDGQRVMKRVSYPNDTSKKPYAEIYVRDAQGNIMATYSKGDPYFEPIDTSYNKIFTKLINSQGLASVAAFIKTEFAHNDTFYTKLYKYLPDTAMIDSFTNSEIINCIGDKLVTELYGCCSSCGSNSSTVMRAVLDSATAHSNPLIDELLLCKPELVLEVLLNDKCSSFFTNLGGTARSFLYSNFIPLYQRVNSFPGDTVGYLCTDVPRADLIYYILNTLPAQLFTTKAGMINTINSIAVNNLYATTGALHNALYTYISPCKFLECLGRCLDAAGGGFSQSTATGGCSNVAASVMPYLYSTYHSSCSFSDTDTRQHIKHTIPLRDFVNSQLQLCYGNDYGNLLGRAAAEYNADSVYRNCGMNFVQFAFKKYRYDSLITKMYSSGYIGLLQPLRLCDTTTLITSFLKFNARKFVSALSSTTITNAAFNFIFTYPKPPGMSDISYLSQVVPGTALAGYLRGVTYRVDTMIASHYSKAEVETALYDYFPECTFKDCLYNAYLNGNLPQLDSAELINLVHRDYWPYLLRSLYNCNPEKFTLAAAYTKPYLIADLFEKWHYPLASFMNHVESYYNSTIRNSVDLDTAKEVQYMWVNEWHLYGSSRIGVYNAKQDTVVGVVREYSHRVGNDTLASNYFRIDTLKYYKFGADSLYKLYKGRRHFEGVNHLGNVLVVFTDKRINICNADTVINYRADMFAAYDYSPFGAIMPGRKWESDTTGYKFGFNGQLRDDDIKGGGNSYDFGARIYDSRLGRFLSLDPLSQYYNGLSPYSYGSNRPIDGIDVQGKGWGPIDGLIRWGKNLIATLIYKKVEEVVTESAAEAGEYLRHELIEAAKNINIVHDLSWSATWAPGSNCHFGLTGTAGVSYTTTLAGNNPDINGFLPHIGVGITLGSEVTTSISPIPTYSLGIVGGNFNTDADYKGPFWDFSGNLNGLGGAYCYWTDGANATSVSFDPKTFVGDIAKQTVSITGAIRFDYYFIYPQDENDPSWEQQFNEFTTFFKEQFAPILDEFSTVAKDKIFKNMRGMLNQVISLSNYCQDNATRIDDSECNTDSCDE